MAKVFGETSHKKDLAFFCIGEETLYESLAVMLTVDNAPIDDVICIREKKFGEMKKKMTFVENGAVLKEMIQNTYKTDDLTAWLRNRLSNAPHQQFAKLKENPKYMQMLNKGKGIR